MTRKVKIAIIGAGTAGLSAFKEARKFTKDIVLIDGGQLGTTCATYGCMPSKVLIQAAHDYHRRLYFSKQGICGSDKLSVNLPEVLKYVRSMRDHFAKGVVRFTKSLGDHLIQSDATFLEPNILKVGQETIAAESIIIATGSNSIIPDSWQAFRDRVLVSETFFEQKTLPEALSFIGAGVIGLELGQALARLGVNVTGYHSNSLVGGLSDPVVSEAAIKAFQQEFTLCLEGRASVTMDEKEHLRVETPTQMRTTNHILATLGRKANLAGLGLEQLEIDLDQKGHPVFDSATMQIQNKPIFIAGDVNGERQLLHEAADEGRIAGYNALHHSKRCFKRRVPLHIVFTEPNIAVIGQSYAVLKAQKDSIVIGEIDFSDQGRAKIKSQDQGVLRVYGRPDNGLLLGAELAAPSGEHLAHLLAWAIQQKMTVFEMLQMPYYHPVLEEGMRTALRQLAEQVTHQSSEFDLAMCNSEAVHSLS